MKAAIVIGAWQCPSATRLNLAAIRATNGSVPILVSEDYASPRQSPVGEEASRLTRSAARDYGASYVCSAVNLGHGQGDLRAFVNGLWWAKSQGAEVLVKLSQRWICSRPDWLTDSASEFLKTGLPTGCDRCVYGDNRWPLRTEATLLDVRQWTGSREAMKAITPRPIWPRAAEDVVNDGVQTFGRGFWTWPLLGGMDRAVKAEGVLWHICNTEEEYRKLAADLQVPLGDDFRLGCSSRKEGYTRG